MKNGISFARKEVRPKEAASILGVSIAYVYLLMKEGQLEHRAITRRNYTRGIRLVSLASIRRFMVQGTSTEESDLPYKEVAEHEGS